MVWYDMIRETMIFFPNDPYPSVKPSPGPVAVVLLHSPRGGKASLHTTLASALPHCDTRVTISRILRGKQVMKEYLWISLDRETSLKKNNYKFLGGSGRSSLPDILWGIPDEVLWPSPTEDLELPSSAAGRM